MAEAAQTSLQAFLFTDIVGSTDLKRRLGDVAGAEAIAAHDACFRECVSRFGGVEQNNPGDGFFATFPVPSAALNCALAFQAGLTDLPVKARVGIHLGESVHVPAAADGEKLLGLAVDTAGRVMSLATADQILITRHAFDSARQQVREAPGGEHVVWRAHGTYHFKGLDEPIDIHEAGIAGTAPLTPPPDSAKARRSVAEGDDETLGWRPAVGLDVPGRDGWRLERELGAGGFGEVWLAANERTKDRRAFKFCFRADRLRTLKRELTLFRLLKETLGERDDIARLYDVRLDEAPFFLEMEYTPDGSLDRWATRDDHLAEMAVDDRAAFVAEIAEALAAAHSVGVLHKDVKASNVLVRTGPEGRPHARLTDFGIGQLLERADLAAANVSAAGFTETALLTDLGSRTGTRLYMAPELHTGRPASIASDVYALGVLLYQVTVGDVNAAPAQGWEKNVRDPLLQEEIAACIAGDPKERPASCDLVADNLRSLESRRQARAEERRRIAAEARRARLLKVTGAAAAVLLLLAVSGFAIAGVIEKRRGEAEDARAETAAALVREQDARQAVLEERDAKAQALDQVLRLSDAKKVDDLLTGAEGLWPIHPARAPAMEEWLENSEALLAHRTEHMDTLTALRARAEPESPGAGAEERTSWRFGTDEDAWRHQVLSDLVLGLDDLEAAQEDVTARHAAARTLGERSVGAHPEAWEETIGRIAASPHYGGLTLSPQVGLVPLGADGDSGLFEFAVVDSGSMPTRDTDTGRLVRADDFALVLVLIPGGTFLCGAQSGDADASNYDPLARPDEGPVHEVTLSPFFLSKYECSQAQWEAFSGLLPSRYKPGDYNGQVTTRQNPVEQVSWNECRTWLARHNLVLPAAAQWEYAARAGTTTPWFTGADVEALGRVANICDAFCKNHGGLRSWQFTDEVDDGFLVTAPVGSLAPNAFGLHDVHGNVSEWCLDVMGRYTASPKTDPVGQGQGSLVYRGGSWNDVAGVARSSLRSSLGPNMRSHVFGVRPARTVDQE